MANETGQLAEIVSDESEKDVNLWPEDRLAGVEKTSKENTDKLGEESRHLGTGYPGGIREILEGKNEIDPGHEHLFPPRDKTVMSSRFESADGWLTGGVGTEVIDFKLGMMSLYTGSAANDDVYVFVQNPVDVFFPAKASAYQSAVKLGATTSQLAYFGVGYLVNLGDGAPLVNGYGFKVSNGTLSSLTVKAGSETLTTISGVTLTDFNEYRAVYDTHGVSFFVNGRLVATHRANLFVIDLDVLTFFYVKTTTTAPRHIRSKYVYFVQKN